ncbi:uncharacterized protein LOC124898111 [Capsicum annuum]|uniref:uncharacterized protein LOC124898111 n=1 Tax=Capsicum annuum TaxID=4072 RepID=UPI001FB11641|nr:uncharacterized protein LOC124898111 [Capsicum annuum]
MHWLKHGDLNTKVFHSSLKARRRANRIFTGPVVTREERDMLEKDVEVDETKQALWGIDGIKRRDLMAAIQEFFRAGKMLKVWNHTLITLVPKSDHAESVTEYRPIACCNTIYTVISKLLTNRLKEVLPNIISDNQSAFVTGRTIVQNILISQDIVRMYNRNQCKKSLFD